MRTPDLQLVTCSLWMAVKDSNTHKLRATPLQRSTNHHTHTHTFRHVGLSALRGPLPGPDITRHIGIPKRLH